MMSHNVPSAQRNYLVLISKKINCVPPPPPPTLLPPTSRLVFPGNCIGLLKPTYYCFENASQCNKLILRPHVATLLKRQVEECATFVLYRDKDEG